MAYSLNEIEERVCEIAQRILNLPPHKCRPDSRVIEDLGCDSLEAVELMMELEDAFDCKVSNDRSFPLGNAIFTRNPMRLRDLAELIYVLQATGKIERPTGWAWLRRKEVQRPTIDADLFTQLGGRFDPQTLEKKFTLLEDLGKVDGLRQARRRTDGMRCVQIPAGKAMVGSDAADALDDERPRHEVALDAYWIDVEPVSTTAWCRFLNSIERGESHLARWMLLDEADDRIVQLPVVRREGMWTPLRGTAMLPIVLVSWHGANAYALWANQLDWREYASVDGPLPSEAQWEHAAEGAFQSADETNFVAGQHVRGETYDAENLPMAPVHHPLGMSRFGLHHMAGNVWQWCRDWYAADFYQTSESQLSNPLGTQPSGIRSERGGSWVGPAELCRASYRRGRHADAFGRCLGFRCLTWTK
ncbi:SUMF1/EgtB/PvdO family nonheme iron enzyme [Bremerella sp. JC817]|uniref:SUMF1/EgtB/PvdO family nonheme iron enzyme n=1 Tax=Bremerella sp. JC817 TaxID=3231756 RepID=UPI00345B0020